MGTVETLSSAQPTGRTEPAATPAVMRETPVPAKAPPRPKKRKWLRWLGVVAMILAAVGGSAGWYWWEQLHALPPGFANANGRLEAEQVEIATKYPGRIADILVKEGDMVHEGQVIAHMDIAELTAQLHTAQAAVLRAQNEAILAKAVIAQKESQLTLAQQELARTAILLPKGFATGERYDRQKNDLKVAQAGLDAAKSALNVEISSIAASEAEVARIQAQIDDSTLIAPKGGRIQYKLAQPGEVLQSGGRVVTLLDLSEVYMTIFVPAGVAGPLGLGDEARVTLDPIPGYVFPANVTFVATEAQFTPKMVETPEEREKLMFRVKLTIDPKLRARYESQVKTGIRGIGFVRTDRHADWPPSLAVKLP